MHTAIILLQYSTTLQYSYSEKLSYTGWFEIQTRNFLSKKLMTYRYDIYKHKQSYSPLLLWPFLNHLVWERSQMTSSSVSSALPPSPRWRHLSSTPLFPKWISAKKIMVKLKITKLGFSYEYHSKQNQSTCCWLNVLDTK